MQFQRTEYCTVFRKKNEGVKIIQVEQMICSYVVMYIDKKTDKKK